MAVPYTFGTATAAIPLSQLDSNFATAITIGNTAVQLGNTVTTLNNMTLANVTISSGNVTITNVAITTANVSGTANISTLVVVGNETVGGNTTITGNITAANANVTTNLVLSGGTANGVAYLNTSKVLTTGSALVFNGTNLGVGTTLSTSDGTLTFQQIGQTAIFAGQPSAEAMWIGSNYYYDGGWKYKTANFASQFYTSGGAFYWKNITSGSANAGITWNSPMTLDASGNLLLAGTTTRQRITIGSLTPQAQSAPEAIDLGATYSNTAGQNLKIYTYNDGSTKHGIGVSSTSSDYLTPTSGKHSFYTGTTASMTLDGSGNLLVGAASGSGGKLVSVPNSGFNTAGADLWKQAAFQGQGSFGGPISLVNTGGDSDGFAFYLTGSPSTLSIQFGANGGSLSNGVSMASTATSWSSASDERLKTAITPFPNALEKVCTLRAGTGRFLTDDENLSRSFLIAQDVQKVLPEAVDVGQDELQTLSLRYQDLIPLLTAAIKEQQSLITQLTARITALEGA